MFHTSCLPGRILRTRYVRTANGKRGSPWAMLTLLMFRRGPTSSFFAANAIRFNRWFEQDILVVVLGQHAAACRAKHVQSFSARMLHCSGNDCSGCCVARVLLKMVVLPTHLLLERVNEHVVCVLGWSLGNLLQACKLLDTLQRGHSQLSCCPEP